MQLLLPLLTLASACGLSVSTPVVARQEAARFGLVSVSPSTVRFNEVCISYHSVMQLDAYYMSVRA